MHIFVKRLYKVLSIFAIVLVLQHILSSSLNSQYDTIQNFSLIQDNYSLDNKVIDQYNSSNELNKKLEMTIKLKTKSLFWEDTKFEMSHLTNGDLTKHRTDIKNIFYNDNVDFIKGIELINYSTYSVSDYAPFIRYEYDTYDNYEKDMQNLQDSSKYDLIEFIYLNNVTEIVDQADRNSIYYTTNYSFDQALEDVGVNNLVYSGNGIKIGTLESGIPTTNINYTGKTLIINDESTTTTPHSFHVTSIIGGNSGIAQDSELYCVSVNDVSFFDSINWLISQNVNIINISWGDAGGIYTSNSSFLDYVSRSTRVSFVVSAGNYYDNESINSYSTGLNVISVASIDVNSRISGFSSAGLKSPDAGYLLKPTLSAPGGNLIGIPNVNVVLRGTSYSAPIVTGIVALLMEQYPYLKSHPEAVIALLIASCNKLPSQVNLWDHDAGSGLINYEKAQNLYNQGNIINFLTNSSMQNGQVVASKSLSVTYGDKVTIKGTWLHNSQTYNPQNNITIPEFTDYRIEIRNSSNVTIRTIQTNSNIFNDEFTFTSNGTFTIYVIMDSDKIGYDYEYGSVVLDFQDHIHTYQHHYSTHNMTYHRKYCECGLYVLVQHSWIMIPYDDGENIGLQQYCPDCGQLGYIIMMSK